MAKTCRYCYQTEKDTKFQQSQNDVCSACRQVMDKHEVAMSEAYYVYAHKCPYSGDIVYVGKGVNYRALHAWGSGSREPEHGRWMFHMMNEGHNPYELFPIVDYGLTDENAKQKESLYKRRYKDCLLYTSPSPRD